MATKRTIEVALSTSGLDREGRPQRVPLVVNEAGQVTTMEAPPALEPTQPQVLAAGMAADLLTRFHYTPKALDDGMSQKIFDRYLKSK